MAVTGDVTFENGGKQMHPYVVALVRWCVSCLWSAATVVLHRIMTTPQVPSITAKPPTHSRAGSKDHIHPEPLVRCSVLHEPMVREADFVFVHGLYGSLENTWRQGDWRSKYKLEPNKVPLRRPSSIPDACNSDTCVCNTTKPYRQTNTNSCICKIKNCEERNENIDENMKKDEFIESFTETIVDRIEDFNIKNEGFSEVNVGMIDNYNMQADFVRKLFDCEANNCSFGHKNGDDEEFKEQNDKTKDFFEKITEDDEFIAKISNNEQYCEENRTVKLKDAENPNTEIEFNNDTQRNEELDSQNTPSNDEIYTKSCEIGCGCICDSCYSSCWPRDWLSKDFPNARIISINYTSDPYLWRPLWVKECKRLRLQERAMQMTTQLLELGVGEKPVVWVGHSKGGLFIKQIYAEAYEAYLKTEDRTNLKCPEYAKDNTINHITETNENDNLKLSFEEQYLDYEDLQVESNEQNTNESKNKDMVTQIDEIKCLLLKENEPCIEVETDAIIIENNILLTNETKNIALSNNDFDKIIENTNEMDTKTESDNFLSTKNKQTNEFLLNESTINNFTHTDINSGTRGNMKYDENSIETEINNLKNIQETQEGPKTVNKSIENTHICKEISENNNSEYNLTKNKNDNTENITKIETNNEKTDVRQTEIVAKESNTDNIQSNDNNKEFKDELKRIANLWKNSAGFMFYSVPHRGSALADIKTPLTARSVELLEISKDCSLVQSLQARWLRAVGGARGEGPAVGGIRGEGPAVRSLVETNRTLMAVLWLRIVSVESADAGVGALCGVPVDHREICKPSGRGCVLYTELLRLIHAGLAQQQHRLK